MKDKKCKDCDIKYQGNGSYNLYIVTGIKPNGKPKRTRFKQIPLCDSCMKIYDEKDGVTIEWTKK